VAWLEQYESALDALETSQAAHKIGNSATLLGVILAMFERHAGELAEGWFDAASGEQTRAGTASLESVFRHAGDPGGNRGRHTSSDGPYGAAGHHMENEPWRALAVLASNSRQV
jgi:hypothetical protein